MFFISKNLVYSFNANKTNFNPNLHHLAFYKSNTNGGHSIASHTRTQESEQSANSASVSTRVIIFTILTEPCTPGKGAKAIAETWED